MTSELKMMRTDHVGSLLRPQQLIDAFLAFGAGNLDASGLELAQENAIWSIVEKQTSAGLPVVSDGEYRRLNWQVSFSEIEGWDLWQGSWKGFIDNPGSIAADEEPGKRGKDTVVSQKTPATSKLRLTDNFPLKEFRFLRALTDKPAKVMLMGPDRVAQMCDVAGSSPHYDSTDSFLNDVSAIQHKMVGELIDAGCDYLQLDEPSYTGYVDRDTLERIAARGEDPMQNLVRAVKASNAVIAGHEGKACFSLHICRGNRASMWHREGTYDGIAEYLFGNLKFDRLLLEYDTERAGGFEPLAYVPKGGPTVVLGLITTKTGRIETETELISRIEDASRFIDIDQLAISPQCGFASGISGNKLTEEEQWRKLEVMQLVAQRVWN